MEEHHPRLIEQHVVMHHHDLDAASGQPNNARRAAPVAVEVADVKRATLRDRAVFSGVLESRSRLVIASKVAGRLERFPVQVGDTVRRGELLAELEDEEYRQQLEQARAEAEVARANVDTARIGVEAAARELERVVQILLDNAVKFMGTQARPRIEIGQNGTDLEGNPIFFVQDNGIGIEPQHYERIFGLFNKLDTQSEGTGIGLALVKRIVEVHGGRIWVESEGAGKGAKFLFTLPRHVEKGGQV